MYVKQFSRVNLLLAVAALMTTCSFAAAADNASGRVDFNRGWSFVKSNAKWMDDFAAEAKAMAPVILPHTWNTDDMGPGLKDPYIGGGWYRKTFTAPELKSGQRLLIEFEGVNNFSKVWVNGGYAGGRNGGFLSTLMDITDLLNEGENTIFVRADNSYKLEAAMPVWIGWDRYGGISRPVWLDVREHLYISCAGVEIRTPDVTAASASTVVRTHLEETKLSGSTLEVRHILASPNGKVVSTTTTPVKTRYSLTNTIEVKLPIVKRPKLWSDVKPVLYTLTTEILESGKVIDSQTDRIGYRFFNFDADKGFTLNGKPTKLKGANIHVFFPGLGNALPGRFHRNDMKLMKKMGCNYMRTSHYPRSKECLDACDELGILVMEEQPYWHGSLRASGGEEAIDNSARMIRDMVRHHGSHPSIIAWNTVNEVMIAPAYKPGVGHLPPGHPGRMAWRINPKEYPYLRRHLQKMVDTFKEVDPDRPVSMVVGGQWRKNDVAGMTSVADMVACNGGALNFSKQKLIGPKTGKSYEFKPDYYRELYPDRIQIMSEGILNDYIVTRGQWDREDHAWAVNAKYWNLINQRPWFCGGSMWCFADYSENAVMDIHGVVDQYRLPKEIFYFYEAMWADHPVLHILGHWNYKRGSKRDVVVFTNCKDVELTLNGKSLGKGVSSSDEFPAIENAPLVWKDVSFEEGTLEARGKFGRRKIVDTRKTAGKAAKVAIAVSNNWLIADGRDISYVDLTICDADGNRCYTNDGKLSVTVTGAARLAGSKEIQTRGGLARVAIRSTGQPGEIKVAAAGKGLKSAQVKFKAYTNNLNTGITTKGVIDITKSDRPADAKVLVGKTGYDLVPETDTKCQWTFKDGVLTASPMWDSLITKESYRDFRMHVEFNVNSDPSRGEESNGNSGVYIQQRYEIQIHNSYGISEADYKASYAGSIYRIQKPDKLVSKPAGQWQSYDIAFRAARFDGDEKVENACITVYHNEQMIHDDVSIPKQTGAGKREGPGPGPIKLQGHHNKVRFRNVWIQELDLD